MLRDIIHSLITAGDIIPLRVGLRRTNQKTIQFPVIHVKPLLAVQEKHFQFFAVHLMVGANIT